MTRPRITEWGTEYKLNVLRGWAMDGLTIEEISKNIGISKTTLYEWMKKEPNIADTLKVGRNEADLQVVNALFENATKHNNTTAQIFWLKNRMSDRWREKQETSIEFSDKDFEVVISKGNEDEDNS